LVYKGGIVLTPNLKFFVIFVISIFAALGIGIYIGFTLDAQNLIVEQREDIVSEIEERFNFLTSENERLKKIIESITITNDNYENFIQSTYEEIIKNKLLGMNVSIIETNSDYMHSGTGSVLDVAGANLTSLITINDKFLDEQMMKSIYNKLGLDIPEGDIIEHAMAIVAECVIDGYRNEFISELSSEGFIQIAGLINKPVDYIIIAGGSLSEEDERIDKIDRTIVRVSRENNIGIIGVEKLDTFYSYMARYKELNISTIDNIDTAMGKVSLVLAMEGRPGHYGVKDTAEELVPSLELPLVQSYGERHNNE